LVNLHEFLIPLLDVGGLLAGVGIIVLSWLGIVLVMLAPFDDLFEDRLVDLGRNGLAIWRARHRIGIETREGGGAYIGNRHRGADGLIAKILHHVLDEHGALGNLSICCGIAR
jgi:hypothetical protein